VHGCDAMSVYVLVFVCAFVFVFVFVCVRGQSADRQEEIQTCSLMNKV
jgi:preprotein translocase subunit YajC